MCQWFLVFQKHVERAEKFHESVMRISINLVGRGLVAFASVWTEKNVLLLVDQVQDNKWVCLFFVMLLEYCVQAMHVIVIWVCVCVCSRNQVIKKVCLFIVAASCLSFPGSEYERILCKQVVLVIQHISCSHLWFDRFFPSSRRETKQISRNSFSFQYFIIFYSFFYIFYTSTSFVQQSINSLSIEVALVTYSIIIRVNMRRKSAAKWGKDVEVGRAHGNSSFASFPCYLVGVCAFMLRSLLF